MDNPLLTTKEVSKYLKINEKKVYQLIKEGKIPCTRIAGKWLFPKESIEKWIRESVESEKDIFIAGSDDLILKQLINKYIEKNFPQSLAYYADVGSLKGILALSCGKAFIAATHLFDAETGEYNLPYLSKYLQNEEYAVINLSYRNQGLIVNKGNPLEIKEIGDITKKKVRFINRNPGSGTRVLFDYYLNKLNINPKDIIGYKNEVNKHFDIGLKILHGEVDVGLGIESVSDILRLDFIRITQERFDLVISKQHLYTKPVRDFLSLIDPVFIHTLFKKPIGYDLKDTGKIIYHS